MVKTQKKTKQESKNEKDEVPPPTDTTPSHEPEVVAPAPPTRDAQAIEAAF